MTDTITSKHNPKIKYLAHLQDKKTRTKEQVFLVEGTRELIRAIQSDKVVRTAYIANELAHHKADWPELQSLLHTRSIPIEYVSKAVFESLSYRESPDGCLGVVAMWDTHLHTLKLSKNPLLLVAEAIEKPGNLGALIRSVEASGADALIACDSIIDLYNPNVIRASQGALFSLPIVLTTHTSLLHWLQSHSIHIFATTPSTQVSYWEASYNQPAAILVGSESHGLSDFRLKQAHTAIRIPMARISDSLNVNSAAILTLYEALRQRC